MNANCVNTFGSYSCHCKPGYSGAGNVNTCQGTELDLLLIRWKNGWLFTICPLFVDYSRKVKILRVTVFGFFFSETEVKNRFFFAAFCMCVSYKSKSSPPLQKKNCTLFFFCKPSESSLYNFLGTEKKKIGSPCSFLLYEQYRLLPSLTWMPKSPKKTITNIPVQYKSVVCLTLNSGPEKYTSWWVGVYFFNFSFDFKSTPQEIFSVHKVRP